MATVDAFNNSVKYVIRLVNIVIMGFRENPTICWISWSPPLITRQKVDINVPFTVWSEFNAFSAELMEANCVIVIQIWLMRSIMFW